MHSSFANRIDSLSTEKEVKDFLSEIYNKEDDSYLGKYTWNRHIDSSYLNTDSLVWKKFDFNADGNTDLFATYSLFSWAVIDGGQGNFTFLLIIEGHFFFNLRWIGSVDIDKRACLIYAYDSIISEKRLPNDSFIINTKTILDTFILRGKNFIELSYDSSNLKITKAEFDFSPGMSLCDFLYVKIEKDSVSNNFEVSYRPKKRYDASNIISKEKLSELESLLNYINIQNLKDSFEIAATDGSTSELNIQFSNGSFKKIYDYHSSGTMGLRAVYDYFFELWEELNQRKYCE